jgi:predicted MFS family arabinose efflux permease
LYEGADSKKVFPFRAVVGGMVAMFLAFGVGRFAYTPLLPLMQQQAGLQVDMAGYLASLMYFGYMVGSIATTKALSKSSAFSILCFGLSVLVFGSWAMSRGGMFIHWAIVMFCIGIASAAIFLSTLSIVLGVFLEYGSGWLTAFLYTGIGVAIVLMGLAVPEIGTAMGWRGAWFFVAITALLAGVLSLWLLAPYRNRQQKGRADTAAWSDPKARRAAFLLIAAYFLHGFACAIGGTFMVAMLAEFPALQGHAHMGWVLVGAMVIPSCIIWPVVASRLGEIKTTAFLLALLALSNLIIIIWQSPAGVLLAAAVFGSSFLAVPGLVLGRLGKLAGSKKDQVTGVATIIYGISMVFGPSIGGLFAKLTGSFDWSLAMASVALLIGSVIALMAEQTTNSYRIMQAKLRFSDTNN